MKTETYTCNLCSEKRNKNELATFIFYNGSWEIVPYGAPVWANADRHVCKSCIKIIKDYKPCPTT